MPRLPSLPSLLIVAALCCASLPAGVLAAGDAERGKVLANTCLGCHGIPGYRNAYPMYRVPRLGGQHEQYIVLALKGYKDGSRSHATMQAWAATLSEQDMQDLAAFFAQGRELEPPEPVTGGDAAAGAEKIATCTACHGEAGISPSGNWPHLAGQHESYLLHSLKSYKTGDRNNAVMMGQVSNLSEQDLADLAAYYAAQDGLFTVDYDTVDYDN